MHLDLYYRGRLRASNKACWAQPPDAENRMSGGVGGLTGEILSARPDRSVAYCPFIGHREPVTGRWDMVSDTCPYNRCIPCSVFIPHVQNNTRPRNRVKLTQESIFSAALQQVRRRAVLRHLIQRYSALSSLSQLQMQKRHRQLVLPLLCYR